MVERQSTGIIWLFPLLLRPFKLSKLLVCYKLVISIVDTWVCVRQCVMMQINFSLRCVKICQSLMAPSQSSIIFRLQNVTRLFQIKSSYSGRDFGFPSQGPVTYISFFPATLPQTRNVVTLLFIPYPPKITILGAS